MPSLLRRCPVTFGEALDIIAKGKVVARRSWWEFACNFGIAVRVTNGVKQLVHTQGTKWHGYYEASNSDIFANDWEVVDTLPPDAALPVLEVMF
jgi:hypothetical protein